MTHLFRSLLAFVLCHVSVLIAPANAQDYSVLFRDFSSKDLTHTERRYLQAALAFEGLYVGLLDGDWGKLSRSAMSRYTWREFQSEPEEWHTAMLALGFLDRYSKDGWDMRYFSRLDMSVMLPRKTLIIDEPSRYFANFRHSGSTLSLSIGRLVQSEARATHQYALRSHARAAEPYTVRKQNYAVTSVTQRDGTLFYVRSHFISGAWSTIMVSAKPWDKSTFAAVTSSIARGPSAPLDISKDGKLYHVITKALDMASKPNPATGSKPVPQPAAKPARKNGSSGTGFVVSSNGHVLTNAHVVETCTRITVNGSEARLVTANEDFDLALLQSDAVIGRPVAVFSAAPARLNSDVTVAGYPYSQLLGGLNVTRGAVSSLKGLRGDAQTLQITAPVQSGNSGGPLMSPDGEIVGVVVSKLNALYMAEQGGDLPQNVNFAIRGEIAKLFLAQNGVEPQLSLKDEALAPEVLAELAAAFTTYIECH